MATIQQKTARLERARLAIEAFQAAGGDVKSPEAAPLGMEFIFAADDLGREFGYKFLIPTGTTTKLDANSFVPCPECGYKVTFFSGQDGQFISDQKYFAHEAVIPLKCPAHGPFNAEAREFMKG